MIYIEFIILYVVLFLSGSAGSITNAAGGAEGFSAAIELARIFLHSIPSLALIWYLLLKVKKAENWDIFPGKKDLISGLVTLPCLFITGSVIAFVSSYIGGASAQVLLHSPSTFMGWVILCFSCIFAAYLEESFFRFYILTRRDELRLNAPSAMVVSVALFSLCHIYEGPWGFLNAALSGTFLCFLFLRYKSLHGIAAGHALYNISVFVINAILNSPSA
ncbi:MAG: CPBP family intramembrane metalloprotease [Treponema sp.]|jgi:membrane protease YdiL (CAAX protease family)|nr:CPBP family intramembrane metalloprotease [Treponema sp.]